MIWSIGWFYDIYGRIDESLGDKNLDLDELSQTYDDTLTVHNLYH